MSYCHVSAQADAHAVEYGRQQVRAELMQEEFGKRMRDQSWVIQGLRNLGLADEQLIASTTMAGDECQAGKLLDIAIRRHVWECVEDDMGDGS